MSLVKETNILFLFGFCSLPHFVCDSFKTRCFFKQPPFQCKYIARHLSGIRLRGMLLDTNDDVLDLLPVQTRSSHITLNIKTFSPHHRITNQKVLETFLSMGLIPPWPCLRVQSPAKYAIIIVSHLPSSVNPARAAKSTWVRKPLTFGSWQLCYKIALVVFVNSRNRGTSWTWKQEPFCFHVASTFLHFPCCAMVMRVVEE